MTKTKPVRLLKSQLLGSAPQLIKPYNPATAARFPPRSSRSVRRTWPFPYRSAPWLRAWSNTARAAPRAKMPNMEGYHSCLKNTNQLSAARPRRIKRVVVTEYRRFMCFMVLSFLLSCLSFFLHLPWSAFTASRESPPFFFYHTRAGYRSSIAIPCASLLSRCAHPPGPPQG